jgi:deoxyribonuclease V
VSLAIACLDVAYGEDAAAVAAVLIRDWQAHSAEGILVRRLGERPADYKPGAFFERELPLLLSAIEDIEEPLAAIVVDGYVWLGANHQPGLGAHLYTALRQKIQVIGVAKNRYRQDTWSLPIQRGASRRPLFVTAVGIEPVHAAGHVRAMHGAHRIPTILALADSVARDGLVAT